MTVHGNQYLLPFFIRKDSRPLSIQGNDELALSFYLLTNELSKNKKIISFSRLLWPILSIQGVISTHIMLDGLKIFNNRGKFSNPPRQPLIGHILRNIDNKTRFELLNRILDVLTYKDLEAEEIGEGEESEFHTLKIDGIINPVFLQSLIKIIPLIEYKPIADYTVLDSSISTEVALNISEGKGRYSKKEFKHFLYISRGSLYETVTMLQIFLKKNWLKREKYNELYSEAEEISRMLSGLINSIKA